MNEKERLVKERIKTIKADIKWKRFRIKELYTKEISIYVEIVENKLNEIKELDRELNELLKDDK